METFNDKLTSLHDSLPEGQHQILDAITAKAFVHSIPEDERDDVQGNAWLWTAILIGKPETFGYQWSNYSTKCTQEGGTLKQAPGVNTVGCWK